MPYRSVWEDRGLLTKWRGEATSSELVQMQEEGQATPNFDAARYSIHDFSECHQFTFDPGEMEYSAAIDAAAGIANPKIKVAIVAANPDVARAVDAYLKHGHSPYPLQFFATLEEARAWVK